MKTLREYIDLIAEEENEEVLEAENEELEEADDENKDPTERVIELASELRGD